MNLNNPADHLPEKEPNTSLLLTAEQEKQVRDEYGKPHYVYEVSDGDKTLRIYGLRHTFKIDEDLISSLNGFKPDLIMVEGNPPKQSNLKSLEEAFDWWGETGGVLYLAREEGIKIISWDLKFKELIDEAYEEFSDEAVTGFLLGQAVKHIVQNRGNKMSYEAAKELLSKHTDMKEDFLSEDSLNSVSKKYAGKDLSDLDFDDGDVLAAPVGGGKTNEVSRWLGSRRDPTAVEKIWEHLSRFDRVFVVAGRSHAITWKPVFEGLMGEAKFLNQEEN